MINHNIDKNVLSINLNSVMAFMLLGLLGCNSKSLNSNSSTNQFEIITVREYRVEFITVEPKSPAALSLGDKLNVFVDYEVSSNNLLQIWARPYRYGNRVRGYRAHQLITISKSDNAKGVAECWFSFDKSESIDEIRIFMQDAKTKKIIKTISYKIDAKWIDASSNKTEPLTRKENDS